MKTASTKTQNIYKMICSTFGHKFSFNAKNIQEAEAKKNEFARYHSHNPKDYAVEQTNEEKMMHNEYVD